MLIPYFINFEWIDILKILNGFFGYTISEKLFSRYLKKSKKEKSIGLVFLGFYEKADLLIKQSATILGVVSQV